MSKEKSLLEFSGISKCYGQERTPSYVEVLKGIDLVLNAGETLSVVGPSGCGKSTLLNIMGLLDRQSAGNFFFMGENIADKREIELAALRNREIGFVFQDHHLLPQCSVLENVLIPTLPETAPKKNAEMRAKSLLERVNLSQRLNHRPGELSGGEKQRVAVVRALINEPKLILADEPTGSLDHDAADALAGLLTELNRESGVAIVLVTHNHELANRAAKKYQLRDGNLRLCSREDAESHS